MKSSTKPTMLVAAACSLLFLSGCAISPYTGKWESYDQIDGEYVNNQQQTANDIALIQTDVQNKTNVVNNAVSGIEQRKAAISSILTLGLDSSTTSTSSTATTQPSQASQSSSGSAAPIFASILGVLGLSLHADNRRKDGAIRTAKMMKHSKKNPPAVQTSETSTSPSHGGITKGALPPNKPPAKMDVNVNVNPKPAPPTPTDDQIRLRAYELSLRFPDHTSVQNWDEAKNELIQDGGTQITGTVEISSAK